MRPTPGPQLLMILAGVSIVLAAAMGVLLLITPTETGEVPAAVPIIPASVAFTVETGVVLSVTPAALLKTVTLPLPTLHLLEPNTLPVDVEITGNRLVYAPTMPGAAFVTVQLQDVKTRVITEVGVRFHAADLSPEAEPDWSASAGRLVIDTVGLDIELSSLKPVGGTINPPDQERAFVIIAPGFGTLHNPAKTTFIAIHSGRGTNLTAAGNALVNRITGSSTLSPSDILRVDGEAFIVRKTATAEKSALPADVFDNTYDLVIVTCQQYADGRPSRNSLIYTDRLTTP